MLYCDMRMIMQYVQKMWWQQPRVLAMEAVDDGYQGHAFAHRSFCTFNYVFVHRIKMYCFIVRCVCMVHCCHWLLAPN